MYDIMYIYSGLWYNTTSINANFKPNGGAMDYKHKHRMPHVMRHMITAMVTALGGTCSRRQTGCVLTRDGKVVATGYVGVPSGLEHCIEKDGGCFLTDGHCKDTIHGEENACLQCQGTADTAYCTDEPCINCLKSLLGKGVKEIYFWRGYADPIRDSFVQRNKLEGIFCTFTGYEYESLNKLWLTLQLQLIEYSELLDQSKEYADDIQP